MKKHALFLLGIGLLLSGCQSGSLSTSQLADDESALSGTPDKDFTDDVSAYFTANLTAKTSTSDSTVTIYRLTLYSFQAKQDQVRVLLSYDSLHAFFGYDASYTMTNLASEVNVSKRIYSGLAINFASSESVSTPLKTRFSSSAMTLYFRIALTA
jgi:hypothetical protein